MRIPMQHASYDPHFAEKRYHGGTKAEAAHGAPAPPVT